MWLTRFQYTVAASGEREGLERCGSPGFNPQSPTDFTGMYPVPATPRAYHPSFTRDIVQAILVVPQGRALVNRKPYPVCLFFWRGRPSTDAPGVQISILQRRLREHLMQRHAGDPISRSPEGRQPSHGSHEFRCIRHVEDDGISLCPCQAVKSGAPPHQLNRRQYGAGTLSLAFQGERPVAYPRNTSGVQSPDDKQHKTSPRLAVG